MTLPNAFPSFIQGNTSSKINKTGNHGSLFVLILDESGSMGRFHNDTIEGVNTLIQSQKDDPIKTDMKIVKFQGGNISTIRQGDADNIEPMSKMDYTPSGGTNLYDAIGQTINEVNEYLSTFKKGKEPSVIFQITSDGEENQSRKFNQGDVKALVESAVGAGWMFTYVGANIDAYKGAGSIGINAAGVSNFNQAQTTQTFSAVSRSVTRMKSMMASGVSNESIYSLAMAYTADERDDMGDKK